MSTTSQAYLRLNLFRGAALWLIFIGHIPGDALANLRMQNFGFSDATEIFVFTSGYTAALVFGKVMDRDGFGASYWPLMWRACQLYAVQLILFAMFIAQISWAATQSGNPLMLDASNIERLNDDPGQALMDGLTLQYRPAGLDILPLYMVLLLGFPAVLWLLSKSATLVLASSGALYLLVQTLEWSVPVYHDGSTWRFNPLGWQFLFVLGAAFARSEKVARIAQWQPGLAGIALLYLAFSAFIALGWRHPGLVALVPATLVERLYPIDNSNMDVLRLVHFLCIAYLVSHYLKPTSAILRWSVLRPVILCGQHSLYILCLGIWLSFLAPVALDRFGSSMFVQISTALGGLSVMSVAALLLALQVLRSPPKNHLGRH